MYRIKKRLKHNLATPRKPEKFQDSIGVSGLYRFYSIKNGNKKLIDEKHNLIMDAVHISVATSFIGHNPTPSYQIKHLAIGTGTTPPVGTDTTLETEVFRMPFVVQDNPSPKVITTDFYITDSDYVGDIEEVGIFGGWASTDSANTGQLVSRVLWSYTKSSGEELLVEYQLTIS